MNKRVSITRKVWAFLIALVMVVSLLPANLKAVYAAEVTSYTVNVGFYDHSGENAETGNVGFNLGDWDIYAVVTFYDRNATDNNNPIAYGYKKIDKNNEIYNKVNDQNNVNPAQFSFSISEFKNIADSSSFVYDSDIYRPSVRLYRYKGVNPDELNYVQLTTTNETTISDNLSDSGFKYSYNSSSLPTTDTDSTTINLKKVTADEFYAVRTTGDAGPAAASAFSDGKYKLFVEVTHNNGNAYYMADFVPDGEKLVVTNWCKDDGSLKPGETYGSEFTTDGKTVLKILKMNGSTLSMTQAKNGNDCSVVESGSIINGYKITIGEDFAEEEVSVGDGEPNNIHYVQSINLEKKTVAADYTLQDVLGDAINFGVVANTVDHLGHSETNLATKTYIRDTDNVLDPDMSYNTNGEQDPGEFYVGEIIKGEKGSIAQLSLGGNSIDNSTTVYVYDSSDKVENRNSKTANIVSATEAEINNKVNPIINHIKSISNELAAKDANATPYFSGDKFYVDSSAMDDNATIYVDIDGSTQVGQKMLTIIGQEKGVNLIKKPGQLVVFNFKNIERVERFGKINVINGDNTYDTGNTTQAHTQNEIEADIASQQVIWNLNKVKYVQNSDNPINTMASSGGVFLMGDPESVIEANGASCGWIASAGTVNLGRGGEFHFLYNGLAPRETEVTGSLTISKTQATSSVNDLGDTGFVFTVTFGGENVDLSDIMVPDGATQDSSVSGKYIVTIKKGETATFSKIPNGTTYEVVEAVESPYSLSGIVDKNITETNTTGSGATCTVDTKMVNGTIDTSDAARRNASFEYINKMDGPNVDISKKAVGESDELEGATIFITGENSDGTPIKFTRSNVDSSVALINADELAAEGGADTIKFTSGTSAATLLNLPNGTYTMHEEAAPNGYKVATNITFTIENGVVTGGSAVTPAENDNNAIVTMVDDLAGNLTLTKTITGATLGNLNDITFTITGPEFSTPKVVTLNSTTASATPWSNPTAGTYVYTLNNIALGEYTITETANGEKAPYKLISTVVTPTNSKTTVSHKTTSNVTFANTYKEMCDLIVTKTVEGDAPDKADASFDVVVTLLNSNDTPYIGEVSLPNGASTTTRTDSEGKVRFTIKDNGSVTIGDIPVGIKYTVEEPTNTTSASTMIEHGYTYDTAETGMISSGDNTVTLTNTYTEKKVNVSVTKNWAGEGTHPNSVDVQLKADGNNSGAVVTLNDSNSWSKTWNDLPKYSYDGSSKTWNEIVYTVDETAVPDGYERTFGANDPVVSGNNKSFTITNTKSAIETGELDITKTVTGNAPDKNDKTFAIDVVMTKADAAYSSENVNVKIGSSTTTSTTDSTGKITINLKAGEKAEITNIEQGVECSVHEQQPASGAKTYGYTYDTSTYTKTIGATKQEVTISNSYTAETTSLTVNKTWVGDTDTDRPASIRVQLLKNNSNVSGEIKEITAADGWTGEWTGLDKYSYDTANKEWKENTYSVSEESVPGYTSEVSVSGTTATVINTKSDLTATSIELSATKSFVDGTLQGNDFTFTLTGEGQNQTKKNDVNGNITFDSITLDEEKTYTFKVKETAGTDSLITYDTTEYTVNVVVGKNTAGTALEVKSTTYNNGSENVNAMTFTNEKNDLAATSIDLTATKTFTGGTLQGNDFTFTLTGEGQNQTKKNDVNGNITFDSITLDEEKTYTFKVKETAGTDSLITYDTTEYTVNVVVGKNTAGTALEVKSTTYNNGSENVNAMTFTNEKNDLAATSIDLTATKTFTGGTLQGNDFTFTLTGEGQNQTKKNDVNGNITFDSITLDEEKTYTFKVKETAGTDSLITYDATEYTVNVVVGKNTAGTALEVKSTTYNNGSENVNAMTFTNEKNDLAATSIDLTATKTFTGGTLQGNDFTFTLTGEGQNQTKKNDVNGNITFDSITLDEEKTYTFKVKETAGTDSLITYDTTEYTVNVVVGKNSAGNALEVKSTTYKKGDDAVSAMTFTNTKSTTPVEKGYINLTKTIKGEVNEDDLKTMTFTVKKGNDTVATYTLRDDFTKDTSTGVYKLNTDKVLEAVIGDDYTVVESMYKNGNKDTEVSVSYNITVGSGTPTSGTGDTTNVFSVTTGNTTTVAFKNAYKCAPVKFTKETLFEGAYKAIDGAKLAIYKLDDNNEKVSDTPITTWTSSVTEEYWFTLDAGKYAVEEVEAPNGYAKSDELVKFELIVDDEGVGTLTKIGNDGPGSVDGNTGKVAFYNDPIGILYVHVTVETPNDTEGKETKDVPNAEVEVTDENGQVVGTYKTNDKGEVVDSTTGKYPELTPGKYTVKITKIPDNYEFKDKLDGQESTVEVPQGGQGKHEAVIETLLGGLDIIVVEEDTGRVVPGAKVLVTKPDGTTEECVTDKNGMITKFAQKDEFGNYTSPLGKYTYKVTWVPDGYKVTLNEENEGVVKKGELTSLESKINTITGGLKVRVLEEGTNRIVPGATVEIKAPEGTTFPDGSTTITAITNEDGYLTTYKGKDGETYSLVSGLEPGKYQITVTKVPEGYNVTTGKTETVEVVAGKVTPHTAWIAAPATKTTTPATTTTAAKSVDTGDHMNVIPFIILMIVSLISSIVVIIRKRRLRYEY